MCERQQVDLDSAGAVVAVVATVVLMMVAPVVVLAVVWLWPRQRLAQSLAPWLPHHLLQSGLHSLMKWESIVDSTIVPEPRLEGSAVAQCGEL